MDGVIKSTETSVSPDTGSFIDLQYIVDWLNYWISQGLPIQSLFEHRVPVPQEIEDKDDEKFPLIVFGDPGEVGSLGLLGILSSFAESKGYRFAADYDTPTGSPGMGEILRSVSLIKNDDPSLKNPIEEGEKSP